MKKSGKNGDSENTSNDLTPDQDQPRTSANIHKQNIYIVSFPIICLFNILRSILYQLFVIFRYIFTTSYRVVYRPYRKKDLEIVVSATKNNTEINEMSIPKTGPGPGDPLLAKQKHHHRRAFEYISKALKIDEENEGMFCFNFFLLLSSFMADIFMVVIKRSSETSDCLLCVCCLVQHYSVKKNNLKLFFFYYLN